MLLSPISDSAFFAAIAKVLRIRPDDGAGADSIAFTKNQWANEMNVRTDHRIMAELSPHHR